MANQLSLFSNTTNLAAIDEFDDALKAGQVALPAAGGGGDYLRMGKDGVWAYGQDATEPEPDVKWVANPLSFQHGWVCWEDSNKTGEVMVKFSDPRPDQPTPDYQPQVAVDLICIEGADDGVTVTFNTSSKGGIAAYNDLYKEVVNRPSRAHPLPVVTLENTHYTHKSYGKIYKPVFAVVDWADGERNLLSEGAKEAPAETTGTGANTAEEPVRRRKRRG